MIIVVLGMPLNVATIILGCIFSMLLSDFSARGLRSIPTFTFLFFCLSFLFLFIYNIMLLVLSLLYLKFHRSLN